MYARLRRHDMSWLSFCGWLLRNFEFRSNADHDPTQQHVHSFLQPMSFECMGLRDTVLRGLIEYGITKPSPVQRCIVPILSGVDLCVESACGTGKTVAVAIGALQILDATIDAVQCLIVVPTRELAIGTAHMIKG